MEEQLLALCTELGKLTEQNRTAFLDKTPQLLRPSVVTDLAEAVRHQVRVDVAHALVLSEAAVAVARRLCEDEPIAMSLRAKANALWFMGECKSAIELFREATSLFEKVGNRSEMGRTLSSSIQSFVLLGEYDDALVAAAQAREIFADIGDTLRIARLELNVANLYHRQNDVSQALTAYRRAYDQLLPLNDVEGIGVALHNIAVCLIIMDDFDGALNTYRRMREFCVERNMPLLAQADYNIAFLFYLRGEYGRALELLRSSREGCLKHGDKYHLGLCDLDQSEIYLELGLIEESVDMAGKSFAQFQELGMNFEAARSLANLAVAAGLQDDSSRSLQLFSQAKKIFLREKNQVWPFLLDLYKAIVLFKEGDYSEARHLAFAALEFFQTDQIPSKHVLCLLLLTRIALKAGQLDDASRYSRAALDKISTLDSLILSYQAHFLRGQIYEAVGKPIDAFDSYQASRLALESLRGSLETDELKIAFMKDKVEVYARLVQLCLDRDSGPASSAEAFSYVEQAKSRTLHDLLFGRGQLQAAPEPDGETPRRVADLKKELNWCYRRIEREQLSAEGAPAELVESIRSRARFHERELLRLARQTPSSSIGSSLLTAGIASLEEIRASLDSEASLVEYFYVGDRVFAIVLTASALDFIPVSSAAAVAEHLRMLQFQMSKVRLGGEYFAKFQESLSQAARKHLHAIYQEIFAPIRDLLNTPHLVIVPYGPLHSLPFQALYDGSEFLLDVFNVSYAPSASIHAFCQRSANRRRGISLILGIEDPKIPFIRQEVEAVAGVVPHPEILLGADANEEALRRDGARSRLIHIASHGYFRQDNPMFSSIRLADSYLSLYDLYNMQLPVDLLTLSGCVTGLDVIADGDELIGLSRGLLYAGAKSMLLSLWDVDDRSTAQFMELFYSHLFRPENKAEALRSAMLELRKTYPHPYYWAPFRLVGNFASEQAALI